jgi:hypothetical protein
LTQSQEIVLELLTPNYAPGSSNPKFRPSSSALSPTSLQCDLILIITQNGDIAITPGPPSISSYIDKFTI